MKKIVLISCSKEKEPGKHRAEDLYIGSLYKKELAYAKHVIKPDMIFILSDKYHLLELSTEVSDYKGMFKQQPAAERKKWAQKVLASLKEKTDMEKDEFTILAGEKYFHYLIPALKKYKTPLHEKGRIGEQEHWLKEELAKRGIKV
ncbi:DUF6884 domain-containing protein [Treponema sp. Marseille-Q4523]|uniref:DUF6884 domain-containing protein n=1 Tax=Treponema sp. Marseille-Q4523 TaxID=2810610 RepID=UPI00195F35F6|nr:DUF6884 domain-containing protein [Treponema sp. Marseille-Q4523]MBM7023462.1 hypothetical protein [Treponema sp. Marseille-Q4523]